MSFNIFIVKKDVRKSPWLFIRYCFYYIEYTRIVIFNTVVNYLFVYANRHDNIVLHHVLEPLPYDLFIYFV